MKNLAPIAFLLLAACGSDDAPAGQSAAASGASGPGSGGSSASGAGGGCAVVSAVTVDGAAIPGKDVTLGVSDDGSGHAYELAWSAGKGTLSAPTGTSVTWSIPEDAAVHVAEQVTVTAVATAPGCADQTVTTDVAVDWPAALRTLVLENPMARGSSDVADHYASFRQIPPENRCKVASSDPTNLAGADYEAWLGAVMACVDALGPHIHVIVPVWGVPYKVDGRIDDLAQPSKAAVSLDALLAYGKDSAALTAAVQNPYYQQGQSMTGTYEPWVPFGELRAADPKDYFLVARIDGADVDAAKALVDRTEAAEMLASQGKLEGVVYVDGNKGVPHPATDDFGSYESGEWNIIGVETVFHALKTYDVVADYNGEEFGTAPAPLACPDALYYAGWYSYGNYNDVFTWKPGAIGGHLDSCSACDIRGDQDWSARALRKGITATFGAVSEPYVAGMPEYDQFFAYLTAGASFGEAAYESTVIGAWMMVWVGDPLYRPYGSL